MRAWELFESKDVQYWQMVKDQDDINGPFARGLLNNWILKICPMADGQITMFTYLDKERLVAGNAIDQAEDYSWGNLDSLKRDGFLKPFRWNLKEHYLFEKELSDYKTALKNKWNFPADLMKFLDDNGFKAIGDGNYSDVFAKPGSSFVLKIGHREIKNDCYPKFVEYARQNQKDPHMPRIGKIRWFGEGDNSFFVIPVERLEPWNDYDFNQFWVKWCYYYRTKKPFPSEIAEQSKPYSSLLKSLAKIIDIFGSECLIDVHNINIMQRHGIPVITDPLGVEH